MDFNKLTTRYKQFGGYRLILEYARLGALWPAMKAFIRCLIKRQSFKGIYPEVLKKVEPFLKRKYGTQIPQKAQLIRKSTNLPNNTNLIVWFCWLQGIEQAPPIVKACYNSLECHLTDKEIKFIDNDNWKEYVAFPEYIVKKWENGRIPAAMFSDLLRLELLLKYGGTWIDSTVLCTGFSNNENKNVKQVAQKYLDADLFVFQYSNPATAEGISISNWFISACKNNEVLMVVREMLYTYWKDYDCVLDYYIFHLFFELVAKEFPDQIGAMPYGSSQNSLVLLHHWRERFDQRKWDKLTSKVCFHKLAFRVNEDTKQNPNNYYNHILQVYGRI